MRQLLACDSCDTGINIQTLVNNNWLSETINQLANIKLKHVFKSEQ